jgi:N-acetylneuraminate synthase
MKQMNNLEEINKNILLQISQLFNNAHIPIGKNFSMNLSHHFGLSRFQECGAAIIEFINREYCKKLVALVPGQRHPNHFHKKKEEWIQLLYGDLEFNKAGEYKALLPGDTILIKRSEPHKCMTQEGAIFEEISTTHYSNDSFYTNNEIANIPRSIRKTQIDNFEIKKIVI